MANSYPRTAYLFAQILYALTFVITFSTLVFFFFKFIIFLHSHHQKKLSVWKLLDNPLRINQLADQLVPESGYCIGKMNMSREHVVLFLHSHQKSISQLHSLVQVRSTLNFDLLYSVDGLGLSSDSRFFCDNKLLVVINGGRLYKYISIFCSFFQ